MDSSNARWGNCSKGVESWRNRMSDADYLLTSATAEDRCPPAYTPMTEYIHVAGELATCCAFLNFGLGVRVVFEYDCLLEQYRRLAFLSWVAHERRPVQNIPNLERLSCPLLWCRKSFDDHDKLVNHVSTCSYLEQGEYWCPYHQQAERFSTKHPRKQFFKGAVNALRKFGSHSLRKAIRPSKPRSSRDARWSKQQRGTGSAYEDDVAEMDEGDILELDGGVSELIANSSFGHPRQEASAGYMPAEMEDVKPSAAELDSDNLSCPPMEWESTGVPTPDSALSPVSPVTPADRWQSCASDEVQSPISPANTVTPTPWATHPVLLTEVDQTADVKQKTNFSYQSWKSRCAGSLPGMRIDTSLMDVTAYMWPGSTEKLPSNLVPQRAGCDSHHNTRPTQPTQPTLPTLPTLPTQQLPPTSGTADTNDEPATAMNHNFHAMQSAGAEYNRAYESPYPPEDLNPPAMQPFDHEEQKKWVMREMVTGPLITHMGLEGFIPVVRDIHFQLYNPSTTNLRNLQLLLLSDGMACAESRHLCDLFIDTLMDLCNQAVDVLGEHDSPEEEQCRRQIDDLLQHYHETQPAGYAINAPEVDLSPYATNDTLYNFGTPVSAGPSEPFNDDWPFPDPPYMTGASTSGSISPADPPVSAGPPEPFDDDGPLSDSSYIPGASTSGSFSPVDPQMILPSMPELDNTPRDDNTADSPPPPDVDAPAVTRPAPWTSRTVTAEVTCDLCPKVFRGKAMWIPSNMARHKREKHSGKADPFACAECGRTFNRKHNLRVHVNTVHSK